MSGDAALGFAIPAYRRPDLLSVALRSIVDEAQPLGAPIYIADDACDDTNVEVVELWKRRYSNITHDINPRNLGIDRNIDKAILGCQARYVHVMGDDDILIPGFAGRVHSTLSAAGSPPHVICSYLYMSNDHRAISGAVIPPMGPTVTMRQFLPSHGWTLGFIGAHVFNRDLFGASGIDGFGTYFHHLIRLIQYIPPDEPIGFVGAPLVGNRADDESTATWSGDRLRVVFGLEKALVAAMTRDYSADEIARTVASAREGSGYSQFFRLLYWAALADKLGEVERYWDSLSTLVSPTRYAWLRSVPTSLYPPLLRVIPIVRKSKRYLRRPRATPEK